MLIIILLLIAVLLLVLGAFDRKVGGAHAGWLGVAVFVFTFVVPALGR